MKRIVPLFLAALLVVTMIVSTAGFNFEYIDEELLPEGTVLNSSMVYDRDVEYLFAANGTPTVDGVVDAAWANAFSFYNNPTMAAIRAPQNLKQGWTRPSTISYDQVRFMWDENNLYILEERFNETYSPKANNAYENCWSGGDQTNYNILLPTPLTEFGDATSHQIMICTPAELLVTETVDGLEVTKPAAVGTIAPSHLYAREIDMTSVRPSGYKEYVYDVATGKDGAYAGIKSFTAITETGYLQETVIPWSTLSYANLENTDFKGEMGGEFGIKMYFYHKGGDGNSAVYHVNQFIFDGTTNTSDWMGHATVKMIDKVSEYITPDYSWYNAEATEFEIADAADLLGLMYLTHGWNTVAGVSAEATGVTLPEDKAPANDGAKKGTDTAQIESNTAYYYAKIDQNKAGSAIVTAGKTFKITANIDLNPGYTGAANTRPGNIWYGLLNFAGTLDGQGYTIKGLYNDAMYKTAFYNEMGLCNFLAENGTIKNVTLEGSFIADVEGRLANDGIAGVKAAAATITNVTTTNLVVKVADPADYETTEEATTEAATTTEEATTVGATEEATTVGATEQVTTAGATEEATTAGATEQATTGATKDDNASGGCASVAGGAVVALLALAAAPMICRKKED